MKKLLLIAALAVAMTSHAEVPADVMEARCIDLKFNLNSAFDTFDAIEAAGGEVPMLEVLEVFNGAVIYTENCALLTGALFPDEEK